MRYIAKMALAVAVIVLLGTTTGTASESEPNDLDDLDRLEQGLELEEDASVPVSPEFLAFVQSLGIQDGDEYRPLNVLEIGTMMRLFAEQKVEDTWLVTQLCSYELLDPMHRAGRKTLESMTTLYHEKSEQLGESYRQSVDRVQDMYWDQVDRIGRALEAYREKDE